MAHLVLVFMLLQSPEVDEIVTFPIDNFFEVSPEMKEFLDKNVMVNATDYGKFNALVMTIFDKNGLNMVYSNHRTTAPKETFALREGNCLSFTAMYIAMARYCGFDAQFQEVSDLSRWTQKGEFTVYNRHMNCLVILDGRPKEIDFNYFKKREFIFVRPVTDMRGIAHFYNNLGAEELSKNNIEHAKIYFEKTIETDPGFSYGWTNLGILHRVNGDFDLAMDCYKKAAEMNKMDPTPLLNLSYLYKIKGDDRQAERVLKKVKHFQDQNPFHHYELGKASYDEGNYKEAIAHLEKAVKLHNTHPKFLLSLTAAYQMAGETKKAARLIEKAKIYAETYEEKELYDKKLQLLAHTK